MGIVSKDGYFHKQLAAEKRMAENRRITTLTEEQHDALAELCRIRHELHISHDALFRADSDSSELYRKYEGINELLTGAGLEAIKGLIEPEEIVSSIDYYVDNEGMSFTEWSEKYYAVAGAQWEEINDIIERYLREIDLKHKKNYEPTGKTRLF